jgi:ATP-dependent Lon protease
LDLKIIGGISAGVKKFLYPRENKQDFDKFMEKYAGNDIIKGIKFKMVDTIRDVLSIILNK